MSSVASRWRPKGATDETDQTARAASPVPSSVVDWPTNEPERTTLLRKTSKSVLDRWQKKMDVDSELQEAPKDSFQPISQQSSVDSEMFGRLSRKMNLAPAPSKSSSLDQEEIPAPLETKPQADAPEAEPVVGPSESNELKEISNSQNDLDSEGIPMSSGGSKVAAMAGRFASVSQKAKAMVAASFIPKAPSPVPVPLKKAEPVEVSVEPVSTSRDVPQALESPTRSMHWKTKEPPAFLADKINGPTTPERVPPPKRRAHPATPDFLLDSARLKPSAPPKLDVLASAKDVKADPFGSPMTDFDSEGLFDVGMPSKKQFLLEDVGESLEEDAAPEMKPCPAPSLEFIDPPPTEGDDVLQECPSTPKRMPRPVATTPRSGSPSRSRSRPWHQDLHAASPRTWRLRMEEQAALEAEENKTKQEPMLVVSDSYEYGEEKKTDSMMDGENHLYRIAAESIHAVDFDRVIHTASSSTVEEPIENTDSLPKSVPDEFAGILESQPKSSSELPSSLSSGSDRAQALADLGVKVEIDEHFQKKEKAFTQEATETNHGATTVLKFWSKADEQEAESAVFWTNKDPAVDDFDDVPEKALKECWSNKDPEVFDMGDETSVDGFDPFSVEAMTAVEDQFGTGWNISKTSAPRESPAFRRRQRNQTKQALYSEPVWEAPIGAPKPAQPTWSFDPAVTSYDADVETSFVGTEI